MKLSTPLLTVFTLIFMLSGFSGLIYESIWSHYLKLMLGHASYAQVLVLAIFMGGMAIGSMLASRWSINLKNLILAYGLVELLVGLAGLLFHSVFVSTQSSLFQAILPSLGAPELVHTVKWLVAALLILPQSILLGATFPLLTVGILRKFPGQPGNTIARLYFANSFGAAIGILCNSFLILPAVGLPGAALTAGILNILLAVLVYRLVKGDSFPPQVDKGEDIGISHRYLLAVAALTGVASFLYEIGWIRMLTMVLGGSTHSFEMMLAAFILGLAIGGLAIRKYIDKFKSPVIVLAVIQISMGLLAILTIPLYGKTFELMSFIVRALESSDEGHVLYLISSLLISMLVMLPAAICAGTTLPLISYVLLKSNVGDSAIGKVYAWNTVGAIIGVLLASQIIMPVLGLKSVIVIGGSVDLILGGFLLWRFKSAVTNWRVMMTFVSASVVMAGLFSFYSFDVRKMASGVFRYGASTVPEGTQVLFHKDGKTSTVAVTKMQNTLLLVNNGKPDAGILLPADRGNSNYAADEPTMILIGALPYVYKPQAKLIANIGMGSGLTAHTALLNPDVEQVDTVEIEEEVYNGARHFKHKVEGIYKDERSSVIIEDAKTYFAASKKVYDVIISEPPNPWVSGVSSLFTTEFYRDVKHYMDDDGVLIQWMHIYELTPDLLATVYKALAENFSDIHVYKVARSDLAFVASPKHLSEDYNGALKHPDLKKILNNVKVINEEDFRFRKLAGKAVLDAVFGSYDVPVNSDYFPVLDFGAGKARFKRENAGVVTDLRNSGLLKDVLGERRPPSELISETLLVVDTLEHNLVQKFEEKLNDKLNGHNAILDDDKSSIFAYWISNYLMQCDRNLSAYSERMSDNIMRSIDWLFNSYPKEKLEALLKQLSSCNATRLEQYAQDWIAIHLAWVQGDYLKVKVVTSSILERQRVESAYAMRILAFNIASRLMLNEKGPLGHSISEYGYEEMLKDIELRGLLYLLSQE